MKYIFYVLFVCTSSLCSSQQKTIDSLHLVLEQQNTADIPRLKTLSDLAFHYHLIDPEKGLDMSDKAIALAKKLDNKERLAVAYKNKAQNYHSLSKDSLAMLMYDEAIAIQSELESWNDLGRTTFNKGLIYSGQSKFEEANACNLKAYEIFEREKDSFLMGVVLNSIGINQMYRSLYPESLTTYLEAAKIFEALNNTQNNRYAAIMSNIGILYSKLKNYDLSLKYYENSLDINKKIGNLFGQANTLNSIGTLYDNLEQYDKALEHYQKSLEIMTQIKNLNGIASAHSNIGITYISLKKYTNALTELNKAKRLFEELNNTHSLSIVYESIGSALIENPNRTKAQVLDAKSNFESALNYVKHSESLDRKANALAYLAIVNSELNDYKTAYFNQKEAEKLKDSFLSIEKKEEIAKLEAKYKYEKETATLTAKHDKEQAINEAEIEKQKFIKNTSIVGGSGVILASIIGFAMYKRKQEAHAKAKEATFNQKVSETELKALRAQMNPHFIFNSLNSINDYIAKNDTQSASDYLIKFSKLMRETLEKSSENEILLEDDIQILKTYMDIENKRAKHNFKYSFYIDKAIDPENTLVPPMILQPFVENSIIHGFSDNKTNGHLKIGFHKKSEMLTCTVEDNGIGRKKSSEVQGKKNRQSLGVSITKTRLEIINKKKNAQGHLKIFDKTDGTLVEISLPLTLAY